MSGRNQAPPSANGGGGNTTSSGRPGTSRAGRPTTSSNRPMTATRRPGTSRAGTAMTRGTTAGAQSSDARYDEELEEQWEEEYEDESEDEDVFAFVPPSLGPAPEVIVSQDPQPFGTDATQPRQAAASQLQPPIGQPTSPQPLSDGSTAVGTHAGPGPVGSEEETFYFDESTGAVYDAQGRLIQMPAGFDPAVLTAPAATTTTASSSPAAAAVPTTQLARSTSLGQQTALQPTAPQQPPAYPPRVSLERKISDSSSYMDRANQPGLSHATYSYNAYPPMDVLDEVEHLPSRQGRASSPHGSMRQRNNRLSHGADGPRSPDSEIKFQYDTQELSFPGGGGHKLVRYSSELGQGTGLAHGIDYDTGEVGPRGIKMVELEMEGDEDSPYPEVRASVSNVDDLEMPANTFRMWVIAIFMVTLGAAINQILALRYPAPTLTPLIIQVISYPLGKLLAAFLPYKSFTLPRWLGGSTWSLNPGMFNIKEHTAIVLMANISLIQMYALNTVVALDSPYFYGAPKPVGFGVLLVMSSQLFGLGLAGLTRKFLVQPASMIWPQVLVFSTVFNTLHAEEDSQDGTISRFRYFIYLGIAAFVFWWFPGWIFTALSSFSFLCWIWPQSFTVNTLFGTSTGLGMSFLTFDWQLISYQTSPLVTPWWAQCNLFAGFVCFLWLIAPILYWKNVYNFSYMPFNSSQSFDRFGSIYNVTSVLNAAELTINNEAYQSYSQLYLGTTYYIVFWTGFATMTSVLVHTILYHGRAIWRGIRGIQTEEDDVHSKMMRKYRETPMWWYLIIIILAFVMAVICCEIYDTGLPVWGLLLSLIIPVVYYLPSGFVFALTGATIGVNLVSELIAGYVLPSKSLPNMMIKLYSQVGLTNGFIFSQDLKLAHYMKIPPRLTFWIMFLGTVWAAVVQVFVNVFMRTHVNDICSPQNEHQFVCPQASVYFTSSVVWGVIGPKRMFSNGSYYSSIYWALLVGAIAPIPLWLAGRRWPGSFLKAVNVPLFFTSTALIPPAAGIVVSSWFLVGFIFQYVVRKRHFRWWSKYNFITSAAMDTGTIVSSIFIFLVLVLPRDGSLALHWWGNDVNGSTLDGSPTSRLLPPVEGFAPAPSAIAGAT